MNGLHKRWLGFLMLLGGSLLNAAATPVVTTIEGVTWQLSSLPGQASGVPGDANRPLTARFEAGRVDGFSGCNRYFGSYTLDGDRVILSGLGATMMACPDQAMALERAFHGALSGTLRYAVSDGRLTLTAMSGQGLTFQAVPEPQLEGLMWEVASFNNGRHAVVGTLADTRLTLSFADGVVSGAGGCNAFHANYKREGNRLAIGPVAATRRECLGEGVMGQESAFLAALASATLWAIQDGMLDVHRADGERVLTARNPGK